MTVQASTTATSTIPTTVPPTTARACLEALKSRLGRAGWYVRISIPVSGPPRLHVVNPDACALEGKVLAVAGGDGSWWLWWAWAERIAPAEDLETAAAVIHRVLTAHGQ